MEAFDLAILGLICLCSSMIRDGDDTVATAASTIFFLSSLAIYFYPTIRAAAGHQRIGTIFALNLLAGWTLVGWVWAFVWAARNPATAASQEETDRNRIKKRCPDCASTMSPSAKTCLHCRSGQEEQ